MLFFSLFVHLDHTMEFTRVGAVAFIVIFFVYFSFLIKEVETKIRNFIIPIKEANTEVMLGYNSVRLALCKWMVKV